MVTSTPPHGNFGASPATKALRAETRIPTETKDAMRCDRRNGMSFEDIQQQYPYFSEEEGVVRTYSLEEIKLAVETVRTPQVNPSRVTLNVGLEAADYINNSAIPGEAIWQTTDRLLTELDRYRNLYGPLPSNNPPF